jgi:hypothetical protein
MASKKNSNLGKDLTRAAATGAAQGFLSGILFVVVVIAILGALVVYATHH